MTKKRVVNKLREFFGKSDDKWRWEDFKSTKDYPISENLIEWIVGQDKAIKECKLCVDEWISKLTWLKERQWWKPFEIIERRKEVKFFGHHLFNLGTKLVFKEKPKMKEYLPAGPFLLLLGDAGTGKSLLGRAMAGYMTDVYKKHGINMYDVVSWKNRVMPSEPKISIHPTPEGRKLVEKEHHKEARKGMWLRLLFNSIVGIMLGFGSFLFSYIFGYEGAWFWFTNQHVFNIYGADLGPVQSVYGSLINFAINGLIMPNLQLIMMGIMALSMGGMLYIFMRMFGFMGGKGKQGIGGAESTSAPKLLIDSSSNQAPFVDATGHGSSQLFGSIAWDPYQTGDLGTPEHQRVTAGDVHRAHLGVLYIDEIKNLVGGEAITLLTVLEDGQLPIALRSHSGMSGDTSAMAVATEPVPCMVFLIAAGNMDSLPQIHPALMDRFYGYGKVVYMNNDIDNTVENRRKYVQFISQEIKRFNLLPFSRDACIEIVEEARRKSGRKDKLTCYFRQMITILKTASVLAKNEGLDIVGPKHIREALDEHCKSLALQFMENQMERINTYKLIDPTMKPEVGQIYGLAVSSITQNKDMVGSVLKVKASCLKKSNPKKDGYFTVTGVQTKDSSYVQHSIAKVRHVILGLCGVDVEQDCCTHVDFSQEHGVEGPSAGVTMTLAVFSALTGKPIRQDVAITGEINIGDSENKVIVTPIGGVHEKIMAAQKMGFKKVCIPQRNFEKNINPADYTIQVIGCSTIEDYIRECFA
jgi:lon-related putative ATP-dependent protease